MRQVPLTASFRKVEWRRKLESLDWEFLFVLDSVSYHRSFSILPWSTQCFLLSFSKLTAMGDKKGERCDRSCPRCEPCLCTMLHLRRPALLADPPVAVAKLAVAVAQLEVPSGVGLDLVAPFFFYFFILISQFLTGKLTFPPRCPCRASRIPAPTPPAPLHLLLFRRRGPAHGVGCT